MSAVDPGSEFYVVGGPIRPEHPAYVGREADRELHARLLAREYCHVLAPPQLGKTSLMASAAFRLRTSGLHVATLDLAEIGSRDFADDVGRWYYSFAWRIVRELRLRADFSTWWQERSGLTTMQRLRDFFLEVVLAGTRQGVVIFLDRCEALVEHPEAWEIFDAVRACHDARATEPEYQRLSFVLLGAPIIQRVLAARHDSPFLISTPVTLGDFTSKELSHLGPGLPASADAASAVADRVWHWAGGHPYLTQKLLRAVARRLPVELPGPALVDACAMRLFFGRNAVREDAHLALLASRLLARRRGLAARLTLLGRVGKGASVSVDARERAQRELLDLGVLVERDGVLGIRNRIYERLFSPLWVNRNLPVSWKDIAVAAAAVLVIVAVPLWYTQYLPSPYLNALQSERQDFVSAREAWERLRMLPGFAAQADQLFAESLVAQGRRATRLPEVQRIGQRLAELPGGEQAAATMLAEFWDRRANAMAQRGDRDSAIAYTLKSLARPTREREERLGELLGAGFGNLVATIRPETPLHGLEINAEQGLLTTLDERHEVVVWRIGNRESRREQRLALAAEEVYPLRRSRVFADAHAARRLELTVRVDHDRPRDIEIVLRAPSGREAVLRGADAGRGVPGELRFDSRRVIGLRALLEQGAAGTWTAFFADVGDGRAGRLAGWRLTIDGVEAQPASAGADTAGGAIPQPQAAAELASVLGPQGHRALAWPFRADARGNVAVWDVARGVVLTRLPRPAGFHDARFVLGHSAVLLAGERDYELRDAVSGRLIGRLAADAGAGADPAIADNGRFLALHAQAGRDASALALWDLNGLRKVGEVVTGVRAEAVAVDPLGRYLAIGDGDRYVRIWHAGRRELVAECEHPARPVTVAFDPAGQWLVTADRADTLRLWDFVSGCRPLITREGNGRWLAAFSSDGDRAIFGNYSRGFEAFSLPTGQRLGVAIQPGMTGAGSAPASAASVPRLVPALELAVTYDGRRAVKLWSQPRRAGESSTVMADGSGRVAVSDRSRLVAFGSGAGDVRLLPWEGAPTLRPVTDADPAFIGHLTAVTRLAFDPAGQLVTSGSLDGSVRVWQAQGGAPRNFFATHGDGAVHDVVFFPRGDAFVSASRGSVLVVDAASGEIRARLAIQAGAPDLAVSADGDWVYVGGDRDGITRWNWRTGSVDGVAEGARRIRRIALSGDGQALASAGADRVVRLWHPQAGVSLRRTFTAPAQVNELWFSADGRELFVQAGAWLHVLEVESAGLVARRSRSLPDAGTRAGPTADGRGVLLLGDARGWPPDIRRLTGEESWSRPPGETGPAWLTAIAARLNVTINDMGEVRPADTIDSD